jgi:hypothetical protein
MEKISKMRKKMRKVAKKWGLIILIRSEIRNYIVSVGMYIS